MRGAHDNPKGTFAGRRGARFRVWFRVPRRCQSRAPGGARCGPVSSYLPRTRGSVALATLGLTRASIAGRLRREGLPCAPSAVGHWITGHARPRGDARTALRVLFGIQEELWTVPIGDTARRGAP